jgi:hypothetical protein
MKISFVLKRKFAFKNNDDIIRYKLSRVCHLCEVNISNLINLPCFSIVESIYQSHTNTWAHGLPFHIYLYLKVSIVLTCGKHLYDDVIVSPRGEVYKHITSLTLPLLIEVPVPNKESGSNLINLPCFSIVESIYQSHTNTWAHGLPFHILI